MAITMWKCRSGEPLLIGDYCVCSGALGTEEECVVQVERASYISNKAIVGTDTILYWDTQILRKATHEEIVAHILGE